MLELEPGTAQGLHRPQCKYGHRVSLVDDAKRPHEIGTRIRVTYPESALDFLRIDVNAQCSNCARATCQAFEIENIPLRPARRRDDFQTFGGKFGPQSQFVRSGIEIGCPLDDQQHG